MIFSATTALYVGDTSYSKAYIGDTQVWPIEPQPIYDDKYFTTIIRSDGTIGFTSGSQTGTTIYYRVNNNNWHEIVLMNTGSTINVLSGDVVEWKSEAWKELANRSVPYLTGTSYYDACGNIMSLAYGDDFENKYDLATDYIRFHFIFFETNLVNANNLVLPATTLLPLCYECMFCGCTSLVSAPELPATNIPSSGYSYMFSGCTSLVSAPELPATTLGDGCYNYMFGGCTSLVSAPKVLPATALSQYCYSYMFDNCTSLVSAPELPATTLAVYCYSEMFERCTSLVNAPILPATTLAERCYNGMFSMCASLVNAPILPATTLVKRCYYYMFSNCTSLSYVKCLAENDINQNNSIDYWLMNVSQTGTFVKKTGTTWPITQYGTGIPSGWTVIEE